MGDAGNKRRGLKKIVVAVIDKNELDRLAALDRYKVLDTPPEPSFDLITGLAAEMFGAAISLITLVDSDRQFFKSCQGLEIRETPREHAFCAHAILSGEVMVVCDAAADPRFADNPLVVGDPHIRFYAGAPLETADGFRLGTLCVVDSKPRPFPESNQISLLTVLARQVVELLELHRTKTDLKTMRGTLTTCSRELEATEERFRAFMEYNPSMAYIKDEEGRVLYANPQCERLWHLTSDELVGRSTEELWSAPVAIRIRKMDEALLRSSDAHTHLTDMVEAVDGVRRQYLLTKFSFPQESGKRAIGGFAVDITERVKSEQELRASESRYRELFERNPLPSLIYRIEDLQILDVNKAGIEHYGWSRAEFLALRVTDIRLPFECEGVEAELRQMTSSSQARTKPLRHRRNKRSEIWVELASIEIETDGVPARLVMADDITDRIEAKNRLEELVAQRTSELQRSEAQWRGLVEALPQFVWSTSPDGLVDYMSKGWALYSGVAAAELLGLGWLETVHPEDRARIDESQQSWARGESFDLEYRIRANDGSYRWFMARGQPVRLVEGGPITQWLGTTTDIDDKKRSEERLESAVAERTVALEKKHETAPNAQRALKASFWR